MAEPVELAPVPATPVRTADESGDGPMRTGRSRAWAALRRNPIFWVGAAIVATMVGAAVLAPIIAPHDPLEQFRDAIGPSGEPGGPSAEFLLGTDRTGRDYLSRLLHGARTSLAIGIGANLLATALGVLVGATAALAGSPRIPIGGGRQIGLPVESALMRLADLWLSFPILLLTITMAFVLGPSAGLVVIIIAISLWTAIARIVYVRTLSLRGADFVLASRAFGTTMPRVFQRHMFPHLVPLLVVYASLGIAATILFEATLSFLGAGVPPPAPTWGTMLADHISWFATDPRLVLLPGLCITVTVLGFNLLGDALRDALDPRGWHR